MTSTAIVAAVATLGFAAIGAWPLIAGRLGIRGAAPASAPTWAAVACGVMVLAISAWLHRRDRAARRVLAALEAHSRGEDDLGALRVGPDSSPIARAINGLLTEVERNRERATAERATEALDRYAARDGALASALAALWQGVIVVDQDLCIRHANRSAIALLGCADDDIVGSALGPLFDREDVIAAAQEAASRTGTAERRSFVVERADGTGIETVLRVGVRAASRDGEYGAVIFIEDATQQARSDEARNAFVTQATHELRGPLANIRLYVETAMDSGDTDPVLRGRCLNVINQEARRLDRLVADMLSIAEIEAGSIRLRADDVRTDQLFSEVEHDYEGQAAERGVKLEFRPAPRMPVLHGDRDKIAVVIHNLINNAIKYTPEGGSVTVSVELVDGHFAVDVRDTGIGIPSEHIDRIFDRFHRVTDDDRVAESVGTGLGLALARDIARLHGGDIEVESVLNEGSTFRFWLPLAEDGMQAAA